MNVAEDKIVSIAYELKNEMGEVMEKLTEDRPLDFLFGGGRLLQSFEENILGLKVGDSFNFILTPDQAYGEVNEQAIVDVSKDLFIVDGALREDLLYIGNTIPMQDGGGNPLNGTVVEINADAVKLDFNHPMAGKNLHFEGTVIDVRDASEEELMNGGPGMAGGCGGSCGCGSGGNCGDEDHDHDGGGCGSGCGCH